MQGSDEKSSESSFGRSTVMDPDSLDLPGALGSSLRSVQKLRSRPWFEEHFSPEDAEDFAVQGLYQVIFQEQWTERPENVSLLESDPDHFGTLLGRQAGLRGRQAMGREGQRKYRQGGQRDLGLTELEDVRNRSLLMQTIRRQAEDDLLREQRACIRAAVRNLSVSQRYAVVRKFWDEESNVQIASELEVSPSTVGNLLRRAYAFVKQALEAEGLDPASIAACA